MADHFAKLEQESKRFLIQYGDFGAFLHRPDFDQFLRDQVLTFWNPAGKYRGLLATDHWSTKHPFNFPGPFYTGDSDTCGTGVLEAPRNVMNDAACHEYVFRQPTTYAECLSVLYAGAVETLDSYAANGNERWTYQQCRTWWRTREQLVSSLTTEQVLHMNEGQAQQYLTYLQGEPSWICGGTVTS